MATGGENRQRLPNRRDHRGKAGQNFVNCPHNPRLVFKAVRVLGITPKQLPSQFKGFRV
ncbi:Hypothetical predicted protein [Lynx pardinus]|uniref:Uncharacterized protein n=1 Tax=Lynx pardinus TaxID=191816 RepID=A0A485P3M9_LYNPA|nr:Hypothetical predicted protein [Lynx pardinus]